VTGVQTCALPICPELARLAVDQKTTELDVFVTKDGLLPQLDAALVLGPSGRDGNAGTALKNMATFDDIQITATLTYQQSLGARDVRGRLRAAEGQLQKITVTAADVKQQLAQGISRAVGQLELAKRRVALAERTIELAQRNIEVELTRFGLGKSTNFDVLQRQDELKQARLRRVRALIDWRKAEGTVMALTGELLPFYGIKLPGA
jgi:outer membrane protein TolC